ncbi:MAG: hypothetical protein QM691_16240 [Opitutaceae bacterium]
MNKTLLLIICDFLLLNLLALTRWEQVELPKTPPPAATASPQPGESVGPANELVEVMRLSLADEQKAREELRAQLSSTAENLQQKEQQVASLEGEKGKLSENLSATQAKAAALAAEAEAKAREIEASKIRLAQLQRDLELREQQTREQREAYAALEQKHAAARGEIENLNVAVKVAEQEKGLLRENIEQMRDEIVTQREEKQKIQEQAGVLAEGVGKLAEKSGELTREIRENRPINPNTLFSEYVANQFMVEAMARRTVLFGPFTTESAARTVLVSDGTRVFALLHVRDTPFDLAGAAADYEVIRATMKRSGADVPVTEFSFHALEPRVVLIPVDPARAASLGVKIYPLAADPFKFPEAVLVSSSGRYYGEIAFKLDPTAPRYVQMDNRFFKRLFGDFAPHTGDLVFSKTGELLGVMVNNDYCFVLNQLRTVSSVPTGEKPGGLGTKQSLQSAKDILGRLPAKLQ